LAKVGRKLDAGFELASTVHPSKVMGHHTSSAAMEEVAGIVGSNADGGVAVFAVMTSGQTYV
jgi:hypothetical protein